MTRSQQKLVMIVSAMATHYAIVNHRGSDWVASMVNEAFNRKPKRGEELGTALNMLERERRGT